MEHGLSKTRLYSIYSGMKQRCYNPNSQPYPLYGGKGITICDDWLGDNGLQNFFEWSLSHGYNDNLTIDRLDSSKGYSPDNCQWITASENSKRANPGQKKCSVQQSGIHYDKLFQLLEEKGWTTYKIRKEKLIGQGTLTALKNGTGGLDSKTISRLCEVLDCQPGDLMEYVPDNKTE